MDTSNQFDLLPIEILPQIISLLSIRKKAHLRELSKFFYNYLTERLPTVLSGFSVNPRIDSYDSFVDISVTFNPSTEGFGLILTKETTEEESKDPEEIMFISYELEKLKIDLDAMIQIHHKLLFYATGEYIFEVFKQRNKSQIETILKEEELEDFDEIQALIFVNKFYYGFGTLIKDPETSRKRISNFEPYYRKELSKIEDKIKLNKRTTINYRLEFRDSSLWGFTDRRVIFSPFTFNHFGFAAGPKIEANVHEIPPRYCWSGLAPIKLSNGSYKNIEDIVVGDEIMSLNGKTTIVKCIKTTEVFGKRHLIDLGEYLVTPGHPIFFNNDWYRPDEIFKVEKLNVDILYNFHCQPYHEVIVGKEKEQIFSSLGGYCERIAKNDYYTDCLFGRGWGTELAKRYKWLLKLKERIPNEYVEFFTDIYWNNKKYWKLKHE